MKRWRKTYRIYGEEGLFNERREKSNLGCRPKKDDSVERRLGRAEARIKYFTAGNELLKKLEALVREAKLEASKCYQAINIVLRKQLLSRFVTDLYMLAEVSRSSYYTWAHIDIVSLREERDYAEDYLLLKRVHDRHKGKIGYRGLYMKMLELIGETYES